MNRESSTMTARVVPSAVFDPDAVLTVTRPEDIPLELFAARARRAKNGTAVRRTAGVRTVPF
ncbi:hypothetical protein C499_18339 [Halogeometricum borinquense DSM 11551]|uniref:Uncharacterized protein n=1 Tax=Halogeometricum borinquense (strain ATCC 700274 / DSM 11551 / JCM 10706 / KCTC 4070 / PR3) TaxID=469382 RepID=L9UG86_HALBP|nr:hypothetical protein C499_18339 [Halogeometricum borinquense DSM 11551]